MTVERKLVDISVINDHQEIGGTFSCKNKTTVMKGESIFI
jgi:hypothetical protein